MNGIEKIDAVCKSVLNLTDKDLKELEDLAKSQLNEVLMLQSTNEIDRVHYLGEYNMSVLEAIKKLKYMLNSFKK